MARNIHFTLVDLGRGAHGSLLALGIFSLLSLSPVPAESNDDENNTGHFVDAVMTCFNEEMIERAGEFNRSLYTDVYVGQRAAMYAMREGADISPEAAKDFCLLNLVPEYVGLREAAMENRRKVQAAQPNLASLSEPIELDGEFIDEVNNFFLNHTKTGHTDLTWRALDGLRNNFTLSEFAKQLIVKASQTPDLYQWENELYHAHTCKHPDPTMLTCHADRDEIQDRHRAVSESKSLFIELVSAIVRVSRQRVTENSYAGALFWLGAGCHAVQDLAYHRGMTLIQHAGLSFIPTYGGAMDPDKPRAKLRAEKERQAAENCAMLVSAVFDQLSSDQFHQLEFWTPAVGEDVYELAEKEFAKTPDMSSSALAAYMVLARKYLVRSLSELDAIKDGSAIWEVDEVMASIREKINE